MNSAIKLTRIHASRMWPTIAQGKRLDNVVTVIS